MSTEIIVSADSHVLEPPDLWITRIDKEFRDKAPRFVVNHDGEQGTFLVAEGISPKRIASIAAVNMKQEDLPSFNNAGHGDLRAGGWDPAERLKDQDQDGVAAEVIYATYERVWQTIVHCQDGGATRAECPKSSSPEIDLLRQSFFSHSALCG